jgi:hypothetical protein
MEVGWCIFPALLALVAAGSAGQTREVFRNGDKIEMRLGKVTSRAEIIVSARDSDRLLIRLDSIVGGRSGVIQVFRAETGEGYRTEIGEKVSITRMSAPRRKEGL